MSRPVRAPDDPWSLLRRQTPARLALGRSGVSLPTAPQLAFQLAHAQARDAVHATLATDRLAADLAPLGLGVLRLHSAAADRAIYLRRPDLGRALDAGSRDALAAVAGMSCDLAFAIADGLSAEAANRHAAPLLAATLPRLAARPWRLAPFCLVEQGRVAIGDEIGAALGASLMVVLIGERPGLSAPRSLGLYVTWSPTVGTVDAARTCISNIRDDGLKLADAAETLANLLDRAAGERCTGVALAVRTREGPRLPPAR